MIDVPFFGWCFSKELDDWIGLIIRCSLDLFEFGLDGKILEDCVLLFASSFGLELIDLVCWGVFTRGQLLFRVLTGGSCLTSD